MKISHLLRTLLLFFVTTMYAQNKQFLYGFQEIPQSLLENPGGEVRFTKHISIPFLSGVYASASTNNRLISNLFINDGINVNSKIRNIITQLRTRDFVSINEQLDIINIGFRRKNETDYLNFGFYQELDFISYYPKDLAILFYHGNTDGNGNVDLNKRHNLKDLRFKGEIIGVFHAGISRKMNEKLTVGLRAKMYSGAFNLQSLHNKGHISTRLDANGDYQHVLTNVDFNFRSSGLINISNDIGPSEAIKNVLVGGNLGMGFDVGFTYHLKENMSLTGSILDVGFISYSNKVTSYELKGNFEVDGLGLLDPPAEDTSDYWDNLSGDFRTAVAIDTIHSTYISFKSPKANASFLYKFGEHYRQAACSTTSNQPDKGYQNEVGIHLNTIFRPKQPQVAATLYYSRRMLNFLRAKVTYTTDSHSFSNIGVGISGQLGKFNIYAAADNILSYKNIYDSKKIAVLFGMNLVFHK